jgi:hypothetical protein
MQQESLKSEFKILSFDWLLMCVKEFVITPDSPLN